MLPTSFGGFPASLAPLQLPLAAVVSLGSVLLSGYIPGQRPSLGLYLSGFRVLQVAGLFHHASIGNPINIAIVRLILLEEEEVKRKH